MIRILKDDSQNHKGPDLFHGPLTSGAHPPAPSKALYWQKLFPLATRLTSVEGAIPFVNGFRGIKPFLSSVQTCSIKLCFRTEKCIYHAERFTYTMVLGTSVRLSLITLLGIIFFGRSDNISRL